MTADAILAEIVNAGLTVTSDGDHIVLRPASRLTPDLTMLVREHKPGLLALLARDDWETAMPGLVEPGVCLDCGGPAPRDGRHWCLECERRTGSESEGRT